MLWIAWHYSWVLLPLTVGYFYFPYLFFIFFNMSSKFPLYEMLIFHQCVACISPVCNWIHRQSLWGLSRLSLMLWQTTQSWVGEKSLRRVPGPPAFSCVSARGKWDEYQHTPAYLFSFTFRFFITHSRDCIETCNGKTKPIGCLPSDHEDNVELSRTLGKASAENTLK